MYIKFSSEAVTTQGNKVLKQHHHVCLDKEFKEDCRVWCDFLETGPRSISRPFIDMNETLKADILDWYTDAAKGENLGFGGVFAHRWFFGQ